MRIIAVDVGTSSVKAGLFEEGAAPRATVSISLSLKRDPPGAATLDLKAILRKVKLAIASVVTRTGIREVDAIALCSQMHGLALLDERMEPITPLYRLRRLPSSPPGFSCSASPLVPEPAGALGDAFIA